MNSLCKELDFKKEGGKEMRDGRREEERRGRRAFLQYFLCTRQYSKHIPHTSNFNSCLNWICVYCYCFPMYG